MPELAGCTIDTETGVNSDSLVESSKRLPSKDRVAVVEEGYELVWGDAILFLTVDGGGGKCALL